ncbi:MULTISPECIES: hypothetical protein [Rhizobium]|uniref:hypothetical protein n=1 Tax=Rhizobium TaxID=379 RepID=UPI00102FBBE6|nr:MULTISPECIES: hypothetical protein [Rhizobium]MBY5826327.1 hypothetical protein [Rhizobium leguminosarum]TBA44962.1 hypothetical protein ELH62_22455 [Rhizobium ruizarguesonis]
MWTPNKQPVEFAKSHIVIDQVLYEFDGPMIFTASFGMFRVLFSRIDESDETELYAVGTVSDEIIAAIDKGDMSVRGGVLSEPCFIIELDGLRLERCWSVHPDEMPADLLPEYGRSIVSGAGPVPDTIEQVNSYFSVRFSGEKLARKSMLFSTFKNLVDKVYDSSRKLIAPAALQNTKSATFDFRLLEPAFGSLILNIESPSLKLGNVRKHLKRPDLERDTMEGFFDKSREDFFVEVDQLLKDTEVDGRIREAAERHMELLTNLQDLIPHEDSEFSKVEFNASLPNGHKSIVVDEDAGERLKKAYISMIGKRRTTSGVITIINSKRRTFVVETAGGREVTCGVDAEPFETLLLNAEFRGGSRIEVTGAFYRRSKRDYIVVDGQPSLLN